MSVLTGILYLSIVLFFFSLITFKAPKGEAAMKGIAEAAIATFLVEAILKYVMGDIFGIAALGHIGSMVGSLSGLAAAILVSLFLGTDLICSVAIGLGAIEFSILPGFVSAYLLHFVIDYLKKKFKSSAFAMFFVIFSVIASYGLCLLINPAVSFIIKEIGTTVLAATNESPVVMGFILGGFINVISTSPLSSMALTAMLDLRGIPMGIANVACFAGSFANG
ncbi:MAG: PTS sugar transporter subunit IIC, partial [Erysipelotrichaceae bacterium]|nr:PTS sugar transporter subunit IIC [Erysipelotrichaceae bacterium]